MAERHRGASRYVRGRRVTVVVITVVVAGGAAAGVWAATRPPAASYRTAVAAAADVTNSLPAVGTVAPVTEATVAFPMSGQVASVGVAVGQQVTVGQALAQLNTTSLANQVSSAQSMVATAQAKLAADQTSQTTVVTTSAVVTAPSNASPTRGASPSGGQNGRLSALLATVAADQDAVRKAQQQVDADLGLVTAANNKVKDACPGVVAALSAPASKSGSAAPSGSSGPTDTPTPGPDPSDCTTAINDASADEARANTDEHGLSAAVATLSAALDQVVAAVGQAATAAPVQPPSTGHATGSTGSTGSSGSTGSGRSTGSGGRAGAAGGGASSGGSRSGSSGPASASQIAADQAAVDSANAQLAAAQQNLAAATLVSPIAGTVAQIGMSTGQNASANSSSANIVVVGPGEDEVTTAVTDAQVGQVKPGQPVTVTPDGASGPIKGKVTAIGALGSTTSSGAASYPVTISLEPTSQPLFAGSTAAVSITLGTAHAAVTVPTSAVHTIGGFSVVSKMVDGKPTTTRVTVGVAGPTLTQITDGLKAGDEVMLANLNEDLPTTGTTNVRGFVGGGGFGGGGGGAGARGRTANATGRPGG